MNMNMIVAAAALTAQLGLVALGGEGPAGACIWFVKDDGEVVCTAEGVAFRAPASLPAATMPPCAWQA